MTINEQLGNGLGQKLLLFAISGGLLYMFQTMPAKMTELETHNAAKSENIKSLNAEVIRLRDKIDAVDEKGDLKWNAWITGPGHPLDPVQNNRLDKVEANQQDMEMHLRNFNAHNHNQ